MDVMLAVAMVWALGISWVGAWDAQLDQRKNIEMPEASDETMA